MPATIARPIVASIMKRTIARIEPNPGSLRRSSIGPGSRPNGVSIASPMDTVAASTVSTSAAARWTPRRGPSS